MNFQHPKKNTAVKIDLLFGRSVREFVPPSNEAANGVTAQNQSKSTASVVALNSLPRQNAAGALETQNMSNHENSNHSSENVNENQTHDSQPNPENGVRRVRELVGNHAVLIPVEKGKKKPVPQGWQQFTIERMSDPAYLAQLEIGNIGILLGSASDDLCAIDVDDDAAVEPFLALNPLLRTTLRTKGARGAQFWIQVTDEYPKLTKLKTKAGEDWGEWRADGGQSVIYGTHPDTQQPYTVAHEAKPIEMAFGGIHWPEDLKLPWVKTDFDQVAEVDGQPFSFSLNRSVSLNQMFFVRKYTLEHHIRYDSGLGDFFQYDALDGLWKKQSVEAIKRAFIDDLGSAAREAKLPAVFLKRTDGFVGGLVNLLKATVETRDSFAARPPAIHVRNGMICFEGDEVVLRTFHPSYLSRNQCPFDFNPNADCPRFKRELLETALNEDDILLLQKWAGAVLLGHNAAQRFLMMLGTPGGGKSTLMNILERVIGLQNVSQLRTEHLADKFELYSFTGKTLLTGKDVAADFLMHKGAHVLKALVGQDLLEAEKKGANERVSLRGDFNVGITCNTDLNIRLQGDAGAWRRRLLVVKYDRPAPTKKIVNLPDQLLEQEGAGILRWMVEGAMALLDDLREHGDYDLTDAQTQQVNRLMDQSDSVRRFVQEGLVSRKGESITSADLLVAYYEFCEERGWYPFPTNELRSQLPRHMLEVHKANVRHDIDRGGKSVRGYKHVALVTGGQGND